VCDAIAFGTPVRRFRSRVFPARALLPRVMRSMPAAAAAAATADMRVAVVQGSTRQLSAFPPLQPVQHNFNPRKRSQSC